MELVVHTAMNETDPNEQVVLDRGLEFKHKRCFEAQVLSFTLVMQA